MPHSNMVLKAPWRRPARVQDTKTVAYPSPPPPPVVSEASRKLTPEESTARARQLFPDAADRADAALKRFFERFPSTRGAFETHFVIEPPEKFGGLMTQSWEGKTHLFINLAGQEHLTPHADAPGGVDRYSVEAIVFHECGHVLEAADAVMMGGTSHLRSIIARVTGEEVPSAIQTSDRLRKLISTEISEYASSQLRELVPEAIAQVFISTTPWELASAIDDHYERMFGAGVDPHALMDALQSSPGSGHELPGGGYGRMCERPSWKVSPIPGQEAYVRTTSEIMHLYGDRAYVLRPNAQGELVEESIGTFDYIVKGEPLTARVSEYSDPSAATKRYHYLAISDEVVEVFVVEPVQVAENARASDGHNDKVKVFDSQPALVTKYDRARFDSRNIGNERFSARYVQTEDGFVARRADRQGDDIPLAQFAHGGHTSNVNITDNHGNRFQIDPWWAYGLVEGVDGRQHTAGIHHNGAGWHDAVLSIGSHLQTIDMGEGRMLHLDGVSAIETEPSRLRLPSADRAQICSGTARLSNTEQLMHGVRNSASNNPDVALAVMSSRSEQALMPAPLSPTSQLPGLE